MIVIEVMLDCTLFTFNGVFARRLEILDSLVLLQLVLSVTSIKEAPSVIFELAQVGT